MHTGQPDLPAWHRRAAPGAGRGSGVGGLVRDGGRREEAARTPGVTSVRGPEGEEAELPAASGDGPRRGEVRRPFSGSGRLRAGARTVLFLRSSPPAEPGRAHPSEQPAPRTRPPGAGGRCSAPPFPGVSRGETTAGALGPRPPQTACPVVIEQPRVGALVPAVSGQRAASSPRWGSWPRSPNSAPCNCGREPGSQGGGAPGPKRGARATLVSGVSGCSVSGGEGRGHPGGAFRGGHGPRRVSGKEPGVGMG